MRRLGVAALIASALAGTAAGRVLAADGTIGPESLVGPSAALVGALIAVGVLWREDRRVYKERISDLKEQLAVAHEGWTAQTAANAVLAPAVAKLATQIETLEQTIRDRDRESARRRRMGDGG